MEQYESSRDSNAKEEERKGELTFELLNFQVVDNEEIQQPKTRRKREFLTHFIDVVHKQLPEMAQEYIVHIVFDTKHRTLVAFKRGIVIGGICFRTFQQHKLCEIVFVAITGSQRVRGYGSHLMSHLKDILVEEQIEYILTFADDSATGYFARNGFSKAISFPLEQHSGIVKYYKGGQLMEFKLHSTTQKFKYTDINGTLIYQQKHFLKTLINQRGIQLPKIIQSPTSSTNSNSNIPIAATTATTTTTTATNLSLIEDLVQFLGRIKKHGASWPFRHPVDLVAVPGYTKIIKKPIDLSLIEKRLLAGEYSSGEKFVGDILLMLDNCRLFNPPGNNYHILADELQAAFNDEIETLKNK